MARMYPPELSDDHNSPAEAAVFAALQRDLPDTFHCYHSKHLIDFTARGAREGEIDFVILHPELGLLALEVKGGALHRDARGRWFRVTQAGKREPLRKDPFAQVSDNLHALVQVLQANLRRALPGWQGVLRLPYGHAVCIPEVRLDPARAVPSNAPREALLDMAAMGRLEARIRAVMTCWARNRELPPEREFNRFRNHVFHPTLRLASSLGGVIARDEALLVKLTDQQQQILEVTGDVPRARVLGPAGTGKTVLALEKARRLAGQGLDVCLLCYNRPLAQAITGLVEGRDLAGKVTACNFHQLCYRAARALGDPFEIPEEREAAAAFWVERAPEFLLEAVAAGEMGFDALVVDEAQDLETEWWVTLVGLIPDDGPLWVFCDPDQDIYKRAASMPSGLVPLRLAMNCRATRTLRRLCDRIIGRESTSPSSAPVGEPHEEIGYQDAAELRGRLEVRVERLLGEEAVEARQVVILAPHTRKNTSLAGVERVAGVPIVERRDEDGVLFSTARRFKGLEAEVVVLIDQDREDAACTAVHRYVAASRARHRLVVFCRGAWLG